MDPTLEHERMNQAIEKYVAIPLSEDRIEQITRAFGPEIAAKVKTLYREALDVPVDWRTATIDSALPILHAFFDSHYSWLTRDARSRLVHCFIMAWK